MTVRLKLFHASTADREASIDKHGIRPGAFFGIKPYSVSSRTGAELVQSDPHAIYVTIDPLHAVDFAEEIAGEDSKYVVLYTITDLPANCKVLDDPGDQYSFKIKGCKVIWPHSKRRVAVSWL